MINMKKIMLLMSIMLCSTFAKVNPCARNNFVLDDEYWRSAYGGPIRCSQADGEAAEECARLEFNCLRRNSPQEYWRNLVKDFGSCVTPVADDFCNDLDVATSVLASKELAAQGKNSYDAAHLLRNDKTIWAASFDEDEIVLHFDVSGSSEVYGIVVQNGYVRDEKSYVNNSRAKSVTVYADGENVGSYTLKDLFDQEDFIVFKNVVREPSVVSIKINSVYKGKKWNDLCITRVYVIGK